MKKSRKHSFKKGMIPYLFLLPAVLPMLFFYVYPIIKSFQMAFSNYNILNTDMNTPAGFSNFTRILSDDVIPLALKNTLIWVFVSIAFQLVLGFALALILWRSFRGKKIFQAIVFLPWAIAGFLIAIIFRWMLNAQFGVLSDIFVKLGIMKSGMSLLSSEHTSLIGPIIGLVWYGIPFFAIMILASLQGISREMLEAADVDGVGKFSKLFYIIIPIIKPTILVTVLLRVIWIFNSADIIYMMTDGGPMNSSQTLASYLFNKAYISQDFSYVSAISIVIMTFLIIYTILYLYVSKFSEAGE